MCSYKGMSWAIAVTKEQNNVIDKSIDDEQQQQRGKQATTLVTTKRVQHEQQQHNDMATVKMAPGPATKSKSKNKSKTQTINREKGRNTATSVLPIDDDAPQQDIGTAAVAAVLVGAHRYGQQQSLYEYYIVGAVELNTTTHRCVLP